MGERASLRMGHLDKEVPGAQLLLLRQLGHREHRRETDSPFLSGAPEIFDFPSLYPLLQIGLEDVPVLGPNEWIFKNLPTGPLWVAH